MNLGKYKHYSGKEYEVLGLARHSETMEEFVLYKPLYKDKKFDGCFWVRPKKMFLGKVRKNGKLVERFECLKNETVEKLNKNTKHASFRTC